VKTSTFVLVAIGTLGTFGPGALADPLGPPPYAAADAVGPYQVMNIVRASGFRPLSPPLRRGRVFLLQAMARDGEDVRIAVEASSGRIVSVAPIDGGPPDYGAASGYERAPMYGPGPPYGRPGAYYPGPYHYGASEPPMTGRGAYAPPPEPAPAARSAAPIERSAAVTPRTPLPRPRPAETVTVSPSDAKIAPPEASTPPSPPQAAAANKNGVGQESPAGPPTAAPAEKPAEKPTTTTLPPVTPLD
jgi:hypothetical protein